MRLDARLNTREEHRRGEGGLKDTNSPVSKMQPLVSVAHVVFETVVLL